MEKPIISMKYGPDGEHYWTNCTDFDYGDVRVDYFSATLKPYLWDDDTVQNNLITIHVEDEIENKRNVFSRCPIVILSHVVSGFERYWYKDEWTIDIMNKPKFTIIDTDTTKCQYSSRIVNLHKGRLPAFVDGFTKTITLEEYHSPKWNLTEIDPWAFNEIRLSDPNIEIVPYEGFNKDQPDEVLSEIATNLRCQKELCDQLVGSHIKQLIILTNASMYLATRD